jgi:serine/threonine protein kinase
MQMSNKLLVGRCELIEKIGEGGMAVVYKSRDRLLNRYVAIKILRPEYTKDAQFVDSFRKESRSLSITMTLSPSSDRVFARLAPNRPQPAITVTSFFLFFTLFIFTASSSFLFRIIIAKIL